MYLIVEGMPSVGKSTLAKRLADRYGAVYYKSLLPNDKFGNQIRALRNKNADETVVDLLHVVDLFRNEMHIAKLLKEGNSVVRDKCFLSSLAHVLSVADMPVELRETLQMSYEELSKNMICPDAVILLDRQLACAQNMSLGKSDLTELDQMILGNQERYLTQRAHLLNQTKRHFGDRLILFSHNETLEEEIDVIEGKMQK